MERDMQDKVYKISVFAVIKNLIGYVLGVGVAFIISGYFGGMKVALVVAGLLSLLCIWDLATSIRVRILLTREELRIYEKRKVSVFRLEEVGIRAKSVNHDDFTLYITNKDGERKSFDVSLLGAANYNRLLEDLKIIGEDSEVVKLEASKKE